MNTTNDSTNNSTRISVSLEKLNSMNITLFDNDCGNTFFNTVVNQLKSDGLDITVAKTRDDLNCNGITIITLDEQYNSGPDTTIYAPYNNTRVGFSDSLALAMYFGFIQDGIQVQKIKCGQKGLVQEEIAIGPTDTEVFVSEACDSSFVTISLGTNKLSAIEVAKSIENGLMRQFFYLNSDDHQTDLIYRANTEDNFSTVADYFGTTLELLREYNKFKGKGFADSQTVINPYVAEMSAFSLDNCFILD